ncbi:MAG: hypothetical protein IPN96_03255 [Anaerolineales bacterium]|nr:hypothetical protein [Anaerolineales bacterium]MBK8821378.1 hypothetical protein [Anaerolineales bacterium]
MRKFLGRIFNVNDDEFGLFVLLSILLLGNTVARQMTGIIGISDLINTAGVNQILIVNAINGVLIFITAMLASLIVDRFDRIELLKWTSFAFALMFVVVEIISLVSSSEKITAALVYLMSQQQWLLFPMFFWVLANDIFEIAQAKRLIPAIGSWSFIGKVIGIGATLLPALLFSFGLMENKVLSIEVVIRLNIFYYLLVFIMITIGLKKITLRPLAKTEETIKETLTEGRDFIMEVPSFRYLLIGVVFITACDVILEYRFFAVAKSTITDPVSYKNLYSLYLLMIALASFAIQGFVTSRIVQRLQLKNAFLIQPFVALGSTLAMILSPEIIAATLGSVVLKIGRNTIDESTRKSFQGFVPEERRGRVALFTDNYAPAVGMLLSALLTLGIVFVCEKFNIANAFFIYLGLSLIFAGIAVYFLLKMRKVYDNSLFNWRLKRRKRGGDVFSKLDF